MAGLLLCYHIGVSYLLCFQPLGEKIHSMAFPDTAALPNTRCALRARAVAAAAAASLTALPPETRSAAKRNHFLISLGFLIGAFVVANLIPFFSDFQNIIGSACGAPIVFGWPPCAPQS